MNDVIHLLDVEDIDYVDSSNVAVMQSASSQATLFLFCLRQRWRVTTSRVRLSDQGNEEDAASLRYAQR